MPEDQTFMSEADYALLRRGKCKELTDDQFAEFRHAIERFRLDPFGNQIYFQLRLDKRTQKRNLTVQTGIDGYRLIADRTDRYAGNDDPVFDSEENPTKATVAVYKIVGNQRCAFSATSRWDQYFPGETQGMMWRKMPHLMLGKCAEALALRKAFPAELSGLYTTEEMQQADCESPKAGGNGKQDTTPADVADPPPQPGKVSAHRADAWRAVEEADRPGTLLAVAAKVREDTTLPAEPNAEILALARERMWDFAQRSVRAASTVDGVDKAAAWYAACWLLTAEQRTQTLASLGMVKEEISRRDQKAVPAAAS